MSYLILMRHGRSLRNDGLPSSECNNVLTEEGALGVLKNARVLRGLDVRHVLASTVLRAHLTALLAVGVLGRGLPVRQIEGIEEIRPIDPDEQAPHEPDHAQDVWKRDIHATPAWAHESQHQVYARAIAAVAREALPLIETGSVLLISHYFPIRAIRAHLDHGQAERMIEYRPKNAEPVIYRRDQVLRAFRSGADGKTLVA